MVRSASFRVDSQFDSNLVEQDPGGIAHINGDGIDFLALVDTGAIDLLLCPFQGVWTPRENGDMSTYYLSTEL